MLHLRVVCRSVDTALVYELLRAEPGVVHLVLNRAAAVQPDGDVLEAEIARQRADDVLDRLNAIGVTESGEISLHSLDTVLSDTAEHAEKTTAGSEPGTLVWDELVATTGEESQLNGIFLAFLSLACLLAAVGVLTDSDITIVGAMIVGPEFGPLAALAVASNGDRPDLAARAGTALGVGFPFAMLVTAVFALLARAADLFHPADLDDLRAAAFIYHVGPYSAIVALLAGTTGMLALTSQKSSVLIGVFISVTTVPAAGYAVLAAVAEHWTEAGEAVLQLLINLAGITIAASLTLFLRRHHVLAVLRQHQPRSRWNNE